MRHEEFEERSFALHDVHIFCQFGAKIERLVEVATKTRENAMRIRGESERKNAERRHVMMSNCVDDGMTKTSNDSEHN